MTAPVEGSSVLLLEELAATRAGVLWLARIDGGPTLGIEVIDMALAQAAGIDLHVFDRVATLEGSGLALPGRLLPTAAGPGLPLNPAIGRPHVLPGHVGDTAVLAAAAATLAQALAGLHAAGITHNAINASTLCPGPGGTPLLGITAACALPGTPAADVAALTAALPALDTQAARGLQALLAATEGCTAAQLAEHLTGYAAGAAHPAPGTEPATTHDSGNIPDDAGNAGESTAATPPPAVPPAASPSPATRAPGNAPPPGGTATSEAEPTVRTWGPAVTAPAAGQTRPAAAQRRARPARPPRVPHGGTAQLVRDHPAFLVVAALILLLAVADLTLARGHRGAARTPAAPTARVTPAAPPGPGSLAAAPTLAAASAAVLQPGVAPPAAAAPAPVSAAPDAAAPSAASSPADAHLPSAHPTHHTAARQPAPVATTNAPAVAATEAPAVTAPVSPQPVATGTVPTPGTHKTPAARRVPETKRTPPTVATGTVAPPQ